MVNKYNPISKQNNVYERMCPADNNGQIHLTDSPLDKSGCLLEMCLKVVD